MRWIEKRDLWNGTEVRTTGGEGEAGGCELKGGYLRVAR